MRLRRKTRAIALIVAAFALAIPLSLVGLTIESKAATLLFGFPVLAATCASYVFWQRAASRY